MHDLKFRGHHLSNSGSIAKSLIVEGWRFVPHSYAMVNQWQLLALLRRPDVAMKFVDLPFYRKRWQPQKGLFNPTDEQALESIAIAESNERADVTLRISAPIDFSPSRSGRTAVFGTSETQILLKEQFLDPETFERLQQTGPPPDLRVVTPSRWSAEAYYRAGFRPDRVLVVPHGVDVDTFRPMPDMRDKVRHNLSLSDHAFVFLSVGAMTGNKGIDLLLQAFSEICLEFPHARLVLKGLDTLYQSDVLLSKNMQTLSDSDQRRVRDCVTYLGGSFSNVKMAKLYQVADAYVSPYRGEGFNMPVLEAAASGLPIICTSGGPTDDFVTGAFARGIDSQKVRVQLKGREISRLQPSLEHLTALMRSAIEDRRWREQALAEGPRHVRASYTWDHVAETLVAKLFD